MAITAAILNTSKTFITGMHLDIYEWICFKLGVMIDTTELFILILDSGSQEHEKSKSSAAIISQSFQLFWMEFSITVKYLVSTHPSLSTNFLEK